MKAFPIRWDPMRGWHAHPSIGDEFQAVDEEGRKVWKFFMSCGGMTRESKEKNEEYAWVGLQWVTSGDGDYSEREVQWLMDNSIYHHYEIAEGYVLDDDDEYTGPSMWVFLLVLYSDRDAMLFKTFGRGL